MSLRGSPPKIASEAISEITEPVPALSLRLLRRPLPAMRDEESPRNDNETGAATSAYASSINNNLDK